MYLFKRTQIVFLLINKAPIDILGKYANFTDKFLPKAVVELPKYTSIYNHSINQKKD